MKVGDYITYLRNPSKEKLLYLKDWHLKRLKSGEHFYEVPHIFASDWLNEFAIDHEDDDFMFVYIGAQNTWTPLHADVYSSYSWSVNVIGRKKWVLFPPGEEEKLKDSLGNLPLLFNAHEFNNVRYIEVTQERGDAIFVPSGWHHQVCNELETISINHNFVNACNIHFVWEALQRNLISVENEIKEFRETPEFTSQCQLILKSLFGMDFESFINFITYIATKRLSLRNNRQYIVFDMYNIGKNHIDNDLLIIFKIIKCLLNHPLILDSHLPQNIAPTLINIRDQISDIIIKKSPEAKA
ncbi:JmjC domain-containing protein 4 [Danaus plexippus plexippus]|uniref:Jumonji domain-containing protein 4 n=1 Tax=Danaus plexippus plexippus TaxID=278856 RepID=A0A212FA58_DANPL|nr:JmjC domain-containing protein 4 [Danaus plexippus plexippus]